MRTAPRCAAACLAWLVTAGASAGPVGITGITGTWASTSGPEQLIFSAGGFFRSCFAGAKTGNAVMGEWKTLSPGRYAIEVTHTAASDCNRPPQAIHKHPASIRGQAVISKGELALYLSGEFPPDIYRPVQRSAAR